jgi:hypothetical protein
MLKEAKEYRMSAKSTVWRASPQRNFQDFSAASNNKGPVKVALSIAEV